MNKLLILSKFYPKTIIYDVTQFIFPSYPYILDMLDFLESLFKYLWGVCAYMCA